MARVCIAGMRENTRVSIPDWVSFSGGTVKRVALWLASEVGEGGVFTKEQMRDAFPGVTQVDRRARDLRDEGWVIHTNREDISLLAGEQRVVTIGGRIWEERYQRQGDRSLTSKERQRVFANDDYCCIYCGMSGGENYPDEPLRKAKILIGRFRRNTSEVDLATVCDRCHRGEPRDTNVETLTLQLDALDDAQRERFNRWVKTGRRDLSPEEKLWATYRRLPNELRLEVMEGLLAR